jgi:hypothetical protein
MTKAIVLRWLPPLVAVAVLVTAGRAAWRRDFLLIVLLTSGLPMVLAAGAGLLLWAMSEKPRERGRAVLATLVIAALTPAVVIGLFLIPDHVIGRSLCCGIPCIATWSIGSRPRTRSLWCGTVGAWRATRTDNTCEIGDVDRMKRGLYIVTTYNCGLQ